MRWLMFFRSLVKSIYVNKRQSLLTIGSLIIGVVSILLVLSLGNGVSQSIAKQMETVTGGQNSITINYFSDDIYSGITENDKQRLLSIKQIRAINLGSSATLRTETVGLLGGSDKTATVSYDILSKKYSDASSQVKSIRGQELSQLTTGIAISDKLAKKLFKSGSNVLGQYLIFSHNSYKILSVYHGQEETPDVLMSKDVFAKHSNYTVTYNQMKISFVGSKDKLKDKVINYLDNYGDDALNGSYQVEDLQQVEQQINKTASLATNLVAGVAGISLIVAGFGVMSSTYSSIANRKSEIGLRRAFGATKSNVRNQFLAEEMLIALVSSVISLLIVMSLSYLLGDSLGVRLIVTPSNVLIAVIIPLLISFIFTLIPAASASNKNVLDLIK